MSDMRSAVTILKDNLKQYGFREKGKRLIYVQKNDVVAVLGFERPNEHLTLQFAMMPLFLPCPGFIYYSYGQKLNRLYPDLPWLHKNSSMTEIDEFCEQALLHIKDDIIPLIAGLSTAKALCEFAERRVRWHLPSKNNMFLQCTPEHIRRLYMYSSLYIKDYQRALKAAHKYVAYLEHENLSQEWGGRRIANTYSVFEMLREKKYMEIEELISVNVTENKRLFELEAKNID
jgi:hypothetical protein